MKHTVLAPDWHSALQLQHAIQRHGFDARALTRGNHNVVLVHAPSDVLATACKRVSFVPGERKGYSRNAG
jgi:hypothetical protein